MPHSVQKIAVAALLAAGFVFPAGRANASALLAVNASGLGNFVVIDPASGDATAVDPDVALGASAWAGLATVPGGDPAVAFALQNPPPPVFGVPPTSRLARIDTHTGTATLFPLFDVGVLGSPGPVSTGMAISPLEPDVATVVAFEFDPPGERLLFKVSLDTGEVLGPAMILPQRTAINALAYSLDGLTLYATDAVGALSTLNPTTGVLTKIGDPAGLSNFINGLAFRPEDGTLFAIDAGLNDRLVTLNPATGELISIVGRLGIAGPAGLTFAEPEVAALAGDTNGDNRVDLEDLNAVRNNFGAAGVAVAGDANGDALVDLSDLNLVRNNFGASLPSSPVPEPGALAIVAVMSLALLTRTPAEAKPIFRCRRLLKTPMKRTSRRISGKRGLIGVASRLLKMVRKNVLEN